MIISQTTAGYKAEHITVGPNEEGVITGIDSVQYNCASLEEATAFAQQELTKRNIQEDIIYE